MAGTTNNAGAAALKAVGKIDKATGTVEVVHPDGTRGVLHLGDIVYKGDVVSTSGDGSVGIVFADASTFSLGKSGRMAIDELVYDPDSQSGQSALSVVKGAFSFASGQIAKTAPDAATIKTPVMTIGIRGTTVAGQAGGEGEENSITLLQDADGNVGQVIVSNSGGSMVLSSPNNVVQLFSSYQAPPPPVYISPAQIQSQYGSATDSRPPSPPPGTSPQQIVPNFQPSAPAPAAPEAPQQQQTPQSEQHGSTNLDTPITGHQSQVGEQTQTGNGGNTTTVLTDLKNIQNNAAKNANDAGAKVSVTQQGEQTVQEQVTQNAQQTQQQIEQQANQNNNGTTTGGTNNNNNDNANNNNNNGNNGNSGTTTYNGRAIDGYVANATVFRDMDNDGVLDAGEASTKTDSSGHYNLPGSGGIIVVTGGTDTTTGKPLTFTMKAAAGSTVVTPLTTLIVEIAGPAANSSALAAAEEKVRNMLGLTAGVSLTGMDPVASMGSSQAANEVMAAIAKIVSTVNMVAALTNDGIHPGISASEMMAFLAQKIQTNTNLSVVLTDPTQLKTLLADVPNIGTYLDDTQLTQFAGSLANSNTTLAEAVENASSYSAVSSRISASTSTDGALITAVKHIVDGSWDLTDMGVVFGNGATSGILSQLKAAGINEFTFSDGTKIITAAQAAGILVTLGGTASLTVMDNGANLTQYVGSIHNGFTALVLTGGAFHLDRAELANLWSIISKASGSIVCDLADGEGLTLKDYGDLANMLATADSIKVAAGATVDLGLSVLSSAEPLTLGANAKIIAVADSGDVDLSGATYLSGATKLLVPACTRVTLDATLWSFFTTNDHALIREDDTGLFQLTASGDLTGLNLSMCDTLMVGASNVLLTLAQWDALEGRAHIALDEVGGYIDLKITGIADLTTSHHELASSITNGAVSSLTIADNSTVTLDAAVLLGWLNAGKNIVLSVDADITVAGDISGFDAYPDYASTYFDHVIPTHAPAAEPAAVFTVPSGGGTITIDASDLDGNDLTYEVTGASRGGTLTYNGDGQFTYTPPQDTNGADTFTVTISDGTHTVTQEVAVLVRTGTGSPGFEAHPYESMDAMLPGELVDVSFTLDEGTVESTTEVTVVVYLGTESEPTTGSLLVGGQPAGALWTMTGTIADINAQLAGLQYQAPGTITADGYDRMNVVLYNNGKINDEIGSAIHYHAPDTFTGEAGTAWSDSDNWSAGVPSIHDVVLIDGHKKAVVDSSLDMLQDTVLVLDGATLEVEGSLTVLETGSVDATSHLIVRGTGEFNNTGTLNLSGDITIGADATFTNQGTIEVGGQADQQSDGTGFATLSVTGDMTFEQDSLIVLEVGRGYYDPAYDKIEFNSGNADLNGEILLNVDPLGGYYRAPTSVEVMSGVGNIDDATLGLTANSNDHAMVGVVYDSSQHTLTARIETFIDNETATYGCGTGQDFVFGAADLKNQIYAIEDTDQASGGGLDDTFLVGADGGWSIYGGAGDDTLKLAAGYSYTIDSNQVFDIEIFDVGAGAVTLNLTHESTATVTNIGDSDAIFAGDEEDTFVLTSDNFSTIAGGGGVDTIVANGSNIDLSGVTNVNSIEKLEINTAEDASAVRLTLDAAGILNMSASHAVTVSFNGGSHTDDLFLFGTWSSSAYTGGTMTFTSTYNSNTATVSVELPVSDHTLAAANMMGSDGTHVKTLTLSGSDDAVWDADSGADYIRGADQHSNIIGNIGYGDYIYGGSQDDTFTVTSDQFGTIAGGDGNDTLVLTETGFDLSDPAMHLNSIEKLVLNDANDYDAVSVSLSVESVSAMTGGSALDVSFFGSSYNDDLHLTGEWGMSASGPNQMQFSSSGTIVNIETPGDGNVLIDASTQPGDGYHVTSATAANGTVTYTANSDATDTIVGAANAKNNISGIGTDDTVYGGTKDDIFTIITQTFASIQGGGGSDTLKVDVDGLVDLTSASISGIGVIDLSLNVGDVKLNSSTVGNLNGSSPVTIMGDADNSVDLQGWTQGTDDGSYTAYTDNSGHNVLVQHGINVTTT